MQFKTSLGRCQVARVPLDSQGYDKSGKYWGTGEKLYAVSFESANHCIFGYLRGPSAYVIADDCRNLRSAYEARDMFQYAGARYS